MKLYSEHPGASITMSADPALRALLRQVVQEAGIDHVLESGTHHGLGSTTMVAEAFGARPPARFVTLEANRLSWLEARRNLARFPFVECIWGLSVPLSEALAFLAADECLQDHARWPEIFIDQTADPLAFYTAEVRGQLGGASAAAPGEIHAGEDLLRRELTRLPAGARPLVILDSAGGIGFLEFRIVQAGLAGIEHWLLLDDIHHLKHFRSYASVKAEPRYRLAGVDEAHGWVLAHYRP